MKKSLAPSVVTARDRKGRKFLSIVEAAYDKAELSDEEAQRVNNMPGLSELVSNFIAENRLTDKFKDEEVPSKYGYLSGYKKPKGIVGQSNRLRELFSGMGFVNQDLLTRIENREVKLPKHAEGWFAIPNIWKKEGIPAIFGATYSEAFQKVLDKIKETRGGKFFNYREGQIDEKHLRQSARALKFWRDLSEAQGNPDILIVAAQFGIRHRGRSVRRALEVIISAPGGEVGPGAFAIGIMLLTHPERLQHYNDLWIDCAGDEFNYPGSEVPFGHALYFYFSDCRVGLDADGVGNARENDGSASAFLAQ